MLYYKKYTRYIVITVLYLLTIVKKKIRVEKISYLLLYDNVGSILYRYLPIYNLAPMKLNSYFGYFL